MLVVALTKIAWTSEPEVLRLSCFSKLVSVCVGLQNPATRNRARDHLIAAGFYSQMLYQLSYSRLGASYWHMQCDDICERSVTELSHL